MLSVDSLSKSFGETQVLKNISLDIPDGETTVILGPSGSGKSTLLRCLNLLETPQSGTLTIDDAQVDYSQKLTDAQVRDIRSRSAMVFQQFNLFPNYTALKNVALAPTLNGTLSAQQAQERARELLAKVGLADKVDSYPDASRVVSSSVWRLLAPWRWNPPTCSLMSRRVRWIPSWRRRLSACSCSWRRRAAPWSS